MKLFLSQVPDDIKVEDGFIPFLVGHADGTQNYVCKPSGAGFAYILFTPEATLFNGHDKQLITHYFSPNPEEANTDPRVDGNLMIRATWQLSLIHISEPTRLLSISY